MTLPSRHRIRNLNSWRLRPSTLSLGHGGSPQYWVLGVDGEKHFCFFQTAESGKRTPISCVKGSCANHYPRAPAQLLLTVAVAISTNTRHWPNVVPILVYRLRRWPNIGPALGRCHVSVGIAASVVAAAAAAVAILLAVVVVIAAGAAMLLLAVVVTIAARSVMLLPLLLLLLPSREWCGCSVIAWRPQSDVRTSDGCVDLSGEGIRSTCRRQNSNPDRKPWSHVPPP